MLGAGNGGGSRYGNVEGIGRREGKGRSPRCLAVHLLPIGLSVAIL